MDWDKLRIFHAAAEAGSFTHAGEVLRMSQSAVSRQVSALEKELKVALFHRHARGLVLTEQGEMLFGTASEIMSKLNTAETLLTDTTTKPSGDLRVTAPIGLGTVWVTQRLREFFELYPEIRIELILSDEQIAIAMRAADVAIWTAEPQQSELIRRRLFVMKMHAYASTQYIRRHGAPETLASLDDHAIVSYSGTPAVHLSAIRWLETAGLDGKTAAQAGVLGQQRAGHEVCDPGGNRHRPHPGLSERGRDRPRPGAARGRAAHRADLLRAAGGAEDREEGAGVPRLPGRQGAAVEVLSAPAAMHRGMARMPYGVYRRLPELPITSSAVTDSY